MGLFEQTVNQYGDTGNGVNSIDVLMKNNPGVILQAIAMAKQKLNPVQQNQIQPLQAQPAQQSAQMTPAPDPRTQLLDPSPSQPNQHNQSNPTTFSQQFNPKAPYADLIQKYFPPEAWAQAQAIMATESGMRADAHNGNSNTGDDSWGLYQINRYGNLAKSRPTVDKLVDPDFNVKYAADMYKRRGWADWINSAKKVGLK
jgi:hypothetical protein